MAKYADYVAKQQDNIDKELNEAQTQTRTRNIPESVTRRFAGKTLDDVLESYAELQVLASRQGEDVGKLKKTVEELLELQSQVVAQPSSQVTAEPDKGVTTDDLYNNPEEAIGKVVQKTSKETSDRLARLEKQLAAREVEVRKQQLAGKFDGWENEIKNPDFLDWVRSSPARTRLAQAANQYDFDAASDLLELWYDRKSSKQQFTNEAVREQQYRDATLESSSPVGVDVVETYSRSDLLEKRIAAKMGNRQAERWLTAHADSINAAYREGRITN